MPERNGATNAPTSHLTQPDEGLRRIQTDRAARIRAGLQDVARHLAEQPEDPMTDEDRVRAARRHTRSSYADPRTASSVLWDLCEALPRVLANDTRAVYAARIQLHIQGVRA